MGLLIFRRALVGAYDGLTPTVYATTSSQGTGSGASEANATTLADALANAVAGDIIGVLQGIYTGSNTGDRFAPSWVPTNNGSSGSPIRIVAKYPAIALGPDSTTIFANSSRSELRNGVTSGVLGCPTFGSNGPDYIHWIGFCTDVNTSRIRGDGGMVTLGFSTGGKIKKCCLVGSTTLYSPAEDTNHNCVRIEDADILEVSDSLIYCFQEGTGAPSENFNGVQTYNSNDIDIIHNRLIGGGTGVQLKGPSSPSNHGNIRVRYNHASGQLYASYMVHEINGGSATARNYVEQNLSVGANMGVAFVSLTGDPRPNTVSARRNTIVDAQLGLFFGFGNLGHGQDCDATDNLIQNAAIVAAAGGTAAELDTIRSTYDFASDYNFGHAISSNWGQQSYFSSGSTYSLAAWRTATGLDANSQSLGGDVSTIFVNKAAGNYRPGTAVDDVSSTSGPVGAYDVSGGEVPGIRT